MSGRRQTVLRLRRMAWVAIVLGLSTVGPGFGQPAAVYEIDDYLDPRILGAEVSDGVFLPGNNLWVSELLVGSISDFEHLGAFTDGTTEFAHLSTSLYLGRSQLNLLVTDFDPRGVDMVPEECDRELSECDTSVPAELEELPPERARFVPDYRIRLQYGWYRYVGTTESDESLARVLISAGYEKGPFGDVYDLGLVVDVPIEDRFVGSLGYDWRIVSDGFDQHRVLYFYSWRNDRWRYLALPVRFSFGGERTEKHWRWAPIRLEAGLKVKIRPLRSALQITYAPSYRPQSRGFESGVNHELGIFLDVTFVDKVFR